MVFGECVGPCEHTVQVVGESIKPDVNCTVEDDHAYCTEGDERIELVCLVVTGGCVDPKEHTAQNEVNVCELMSALYSRY